MKVFQNLRMDLARCGCAPVVAAVQGDTNTRVLVVSLYDSGAAWEIPEGVIVDVAFKKPDGTQGVYSRLPDGSSATSFEGNVLTAILAPQALTCPGKVVAAFVFHKEGEKTLASFPFTITVTANPAEGAERSEDYFNPTFGELVAEVEALKDLLAEGGGGGGGTGPQGEPGKDGVSVSHFWDGTKLVVSSASGTSSADLKGEPGKDGVSVTHRWEGTRLYVTSASGTSSADLQGPGGTGGGGGGTGADGADGFSPIATVTQTDSGAIISITDKNGTTTAEILNGEDGADGTMTFADLTEEQKASLKGDKGDTGASGKDGTSVTHSWNGSVLTITSASGTSSADLKGPKGDKGDPGSGGGSGGDSVWTESTDHPGCFYRNVDGEVEWLNPPMVAGVPYRTAERHCNKPVYKILVDMCDEDYQLHDEDGYTIGYEGSVSLYWSDGEIGGTDAAVAQAIIDYSMWGHSIMGPMWSPITFSDFPGNSYFSLDEAVPSWKIDGSEVEIVMLTVSFILG